MKVFVTAALWTFITMAHSEEYKPTQLTQQIGKMTDINDYPWTTEYLVFLYKWKLRICGGILITNVHVLSVATCTGHNIVDKLTVLFRNEYYRVSRIFKSLDYSIKLSILQLKKRIDELGPINQTISEPRIDYTVYAVRFIKKWEYKIEEGIIIQKNEIIKMHLVHEEKRMILSVRKGAPLFQGKSLIGISGATNRTTGYGYINVGMYLPFIQNVLSALGS